MQIKSRNLAKVSSTAILACGLLAFAVPANAVPTTQSIPAASSDQYVEWDSLTLGSVVLPDDTNVVLALTTTATVVDQGWGGQNGGNGVYMELSDNGNVLFRVNVAGSSHSLATDTYDITANPADLASIDTALAGIDWSTAPVVTVAMVTHPFGWPGWELHTNNASFSVTTDATPVPEPSGIAITALAIGMLGVAYRGRKSSRGAALLSA